jgi:phosphatidylglycerophosphate synthase
MAALGSVNAAAPTRVSSRARWQEFPREAMEKLPARSRYFNISVIWIFYYRRVVRLLYAAGVRHELVTVASIVSGLAAAGLIVGAGSLAGLWGAALLVHAKDLFDACDGALARVTGTGHRIGRFLDTIGDGIVFTTLIGAVAIRDMNGGAQIIPVLLWATTAWLSLFLQCSYFNYHQLRYIARVGGGTASRLDEREVGREGPVLSVLARVYEWWFGWQDRLMSRGDGWARARVGLGGEAGDRRCDRWFTDRRFLTLNSALCYGTHALVLILCLTANRPGWFFPAVVVGLNLYWGGVVASRQAVYRRVNTG